MASFFVRNNTSGSSFKSISGAVSRKEASDFNRQGGGGGVGSVSSRECLDAPAILANLRWRESRAHRDTHGWRLSLGGGGGLLTDFRISLMIVAVDRQKLAWLLNENCSASIICVSFLTSCTTQESFI